MGQDGPAPTDILVVGAGPSGLAAGISALDDGRSVTIVEQNFDIGGHGILSGGFVQLGGGHSLQRELGIEDSHERLYEDWIAEDTSMSRFNDRELAWRFAEENAATFEFLVDNGVTFRPEPAYIADMSLIGNNSAHRLFQPTAWPVPGERMNQKGEGAATTLLRSLASSFVRKGGRIRLRSSLTGFLTDPASGRIVGAAIERDGAGHAVHATQAVILATGGGSGNVEFRRIFDPRLTAEYQLAGMPYTDQPATAEIEALRHAASLWGTANQTQEKSVSASLSKTGYIGTRWGYVNLRYEPHHPVFHLARAGGLQVDDWSDIALVDEFGRRFWNESDASPAFLDAALSYKGNALKRDGGGPIWAIFDSRAAARHGWSLGPQDVDRDGYFFEADDLRSLAQRIANEFTTLRIDGATLERTIQRYNGFVASGADADFGKPELTASIDTPPFYAAWSTPMVHDSLAGLRSDLDGRVLDLRGEVIPGLFVAGESQGGFIQHGLGRVLVSGRIAGMAAARA